MLAKRLAIVVMLLEGYSMYSISQTLKVSPTTVQKVQSAAANGAFADVLPLLKKDITNYKAIIDTIESILTVGGIMPAYGQARLPKR